MKLIHVSMLMIGLLAVEVRAQAPTPAAPVDSKEAIAVRASAKQFMSDLELETLEAARWDFGGSDDEFKLVEAFHAAIRGGQHAKEALTKRFPADMTDKEKRSDISAQAMMERLNKEPVNIDGDVAIIGKGGGLKLKKTDGQWRVIELASEPAGKQMMGVVMPIVAKVCEEFAKDVEAGRFDSKKSADEALTKKLRAALMAMPPASKPTTRPAK